MFETHKVTERVKLFIASSSVAMTILTLGFLHMFLGSIPFLVFLFIALPLTWSVLKTIFQAADTQKVPLKTSLLVSLWSVVFVSISYVLVFIATFRLFEEDWSNILAVSGSFLSLVFLTYYVLPRTLTRGRITIPLTSSVYLMLLGFLFFIFILTEGIISLVVSSLILFLILFTVTIFYVESFRRELRKISIVTNDKRGYQTEVLLFLVVVSTVALMYYMDYIPNYGG